MLAIPVKDFSRSITKHNSNIITVTDWVESSVLFLEQEDISQTDILDLLIENQYYDSQDFASSFLDIIWNELRRRKRTIGQGYPFSIDSNKISLTNNWQAHCAYSFCLLLTITHNYKNDDFSLDQNGSYNEQGEMFEILSKQILEQHFEDWNIYQTGWSKNNTNSFKSIVEEISNLVGDPVGDLDLWDGPHVKEKGVDLLCYKKFLDDRSGIPIYLIQCSSGSNWKSKLREPNLKIWTDIIRFASSPMAAFSTPFLFDDKKFELNTRTFKGLLFDRGRLLSLNKNETEWISDDLKEAIEDFVDQNIPNLPIHEYDI